MSPPEEPQPMERAATDEPAKRDVIFVGAKPPMNYVLAILTQFNSGSRAVVLKARGRAISRCVDVAEIVRNRFLTNLAVRDVRIGTEGVTTDKGSRTNVSSIEITLARP